MERQSARKGIWNGHRYKGHHRFQQQSEPRQTCRKSAAARKDAAIAKAKARLEKLLSQPVGAAARKAAKKPSKVVITKVAA